MTPALDLAALVASKLTELDKAIVTIWSSSSPGSPQTVASIASKLEAAGSPKINRARLKERLARDRRVVKDGDGFRAAPRKVGEIAAMAEPITGPQRPPDSKSVLDSGLFEHAYRYVSNIAHQINVSYDSACFDCCAVMVRRLFETLLIDAFEKQGAISEIRNGNGEILPLSGLIAKLASTTSFTVSRQTKQASSHLKDVGDWSAHNRRHMARKSDIDAAAKHLRLACSDLLHLAKQDDPKLSTQAA